MAGSASVAVRTAIITGLSDYFAGLADFNGATDPTQDVAVSYGYNFGTLDAERVFCGRARADTPPAAMKSGRNFRNETGTFDLVVLCSAVGGSPEDAETRALAIGTVAEEWIADRKSNELGVTGLSALVVDGWEMATLGNDNGHMTELTYHVRWKARLT